MIKAPWRIINATARNISTVRGSNALLQVKAVDEEKAISPPDQAPNGRDQLSAGVWTVVVKDNICTTALPTTCASAILQAFTSPFAATVVEKLEAAGRKVLAKSNLDEFGMGSDSIHSIHEAVQNIYRRDGDALSAGGSSGGSAVAVASGECDAALGTDTGGSVRLPAAYTNIVGFKPSYGLISRRGVVAYANSLDTVGVLARSSRQAEEIYDIIKGYDARDPTSRQLPAVQGRREPSEDMSKITIGVPVEYNVSELHPTVRAAWKATIKSLQRRGHLVRSVNLPTTKQALAAYYVIVTAEASSNMARYDGVRYGTPAPQSRSQNSTLYADTRGGMIGDEVKRRILLGSYALSGTARDNYFIKAQKVRRLVKNDFDRVFRRHNPVNERKDSDDADGQLGVDVLIAPTTLTLPPKLKDLSAQTPTKAYGSDVLTVPASLAGLPAISVPVPHDQHVPEKDVPVVGIQVIGQYGDEETVFAAAQAIEAVADR